MCDLTPEIRSANLTIELTVSIDSSIDVWLRFDEASDWAD
ncbi:hypothetical protein Pla100_25480 [Neorhodopirellula pilleata]|uniref:Uncharacterized protein n=1 Tax=Neorhodopirellula pilleata TaxID=2714738 RepID=A0A5C6ADB1_9BACT|nr:hypothetical protein Pla100_25480 [Neorhodopirellula pilleata]